MICVISGIEIMKKEFEGLVKERLRLDPTQAMSKLYNSIRYFLCTKDIWNVYIHICKYILIFYTLNKDVTMRAILGQELFPPLVKAKNQNQNFEKYIAHI